MHGRLKVKTSKEQEEERKVKERERAFYFQNLTGKLFDLRPEPRTPEVLDECFKLTGELLLMNPDFYTVWNIRKECIESVLDRVRQGAEEAAAKVLSDELSFTIDCLKKNEKSYSVWQHRIWILSKMPQSEYANEISLCNTFLSKDERNFHCWDYRSYISDLANTDLEKEFQFTTDKINSNFSNFSAWHRRHKLLLRALTLPEDQCPAAVNLRLIWKNEYNLILNALFTDPSDQSPWLYHNWLIRNSQGQFGQEQLDTLRSLEEMEPDNRWVNRALELARHINEVASG